MLTKRVWRVRTDGGLTTWVKEGWFLFGLLPIYIRDLEPRN